MTGVLAIAGSLRRNSYNRMLLRAAVDLAPAKMSVLVYDDLGSIPLFNEDCEHEPSAVDTVRRLAQVVGTADGVLFSTPEYNWSVPGVLKNIIDWLSRPAFNVLVGKPVAIMGASSGRWGTRLAQANLRQVLSATESLVLPAPAVFVSEAATRFDEAGRLIDDATRAQVEACLAAFGRWINLLAADSREKFARNAVRSRRGAAHV